MSFRNIISGMIVFGLLVGMTPTLWAAQPDLEVPFNFDCITWKDSYDPLPARAQRAVFSAIGSVVFAGVVAVIDLRKMLDLPFDPTLVAMGFFALGLATSLTDYWFTNERMIDMQFEGVELGCIDEIVF